MRVSPSGKAPPSQGGIRGFESHHPLFPNIAYNLQQVIPDLIPIAGVCKSIKHISIDLMLEFYIARYILDEQVNSACRRQY